MMRTHRRNGFTLIELIVVIALISVVTTMGAVMFSKMSDYWRSTWNEAEVDANARGALAQIRLDVGSVLPTALSSESVRGVSATAPAGDSRRLAEDQLTLPVQLPLGGTGLLTTASVRYAVDRSQADNPVLKRYSGPLGAQSTAAKAQDTVVAKGVTQFKVEYLTRTGSGQWVPEWNQPTLPAAIRISLALADPARPGVAVSRMAIFRIPVSG